MKKQQQHLKMKKKKILGKKIKIVVIHLVQCLESIRYKGLIFFKFIFNDMLNFFCYRRLRPIFLSVSRLLFKKQISADARGPEQLRGDL